MSNFELILSKIDNLEGKFKQLAKSHNAVEFEKECLFAKQALMANSYLQSLAEKDQEALFNAILNTASIGITLNPAVARAYLVPRGGKICLDISYKGLCHLAIETGAVKWVQTQLVYSNDQYEPMGIDKEPMHKYNPFGERGEIVGAYCVAKLPNGDYLTEPMPIDEINKIKERSDGYKAYKNGKAKFCPWITDEGEMIRKTVTKRASKYWPKSVRTEALDEAIQYDHDSDDLPISEVMETNFDKRDELVGQITSLSGEYCKEMSQQQKVEFVIKVCKVNKFADLKRKSVEQLEEILTEIERLSEE